MMQRLLFILVFVCTLTLNTSACDICGCKLGGLSYGIMPQYDSHYIGLRYSYAGFNARIEYDNQYDEDTYSNDAYHRVDLMARYVVLPRLHVNVIVPYSYNVMRGNTQNLDVSGMADPMLLTYYNILSKGAEMSSRWKHSVLVGGGIKLPLGDYQQLDGEHIINRNFQLGSGSLDYLFTAAYTLRFKAWGLNNEGSYKMNTENDEGYLFGDQFNMSSYVFYQQETAMATVMPYAGAYYEWSDMHRDNDIFQTSTGGDAWFITLGVQVLRGNWSTNIQYQLPLVQSYNVETSYEINAEQRVSVGLFFNMPAK